MPHELHDGGEVDACEDKTGGKGVAKVVEAAAGDSLSLPKSPS